jgi:hypothetical protein
MNLKILLRLEEPILRMLLLSLLDKNSAAMLPNSKMAAGELNKPFKMSSKLLKVVLL